MFTEKSINNFLVFYRGSFPEASILPKMHILEDHVVPWFSRWHLGFGLMGEQGAESIHAHLMRMERNFQGIANEVDRYKVHLQTAALGVRSITGSTLPTTSKETEEDIESRIKAVAPVATLQPSTTPFSPIVKGLLSLSSPTFTCLLQYKLWPISTGHKNSTSKAHIQVRFNLDVQYLLDPEVLQEIGEKCEHSCIFIHL